MNNLDQRTWSGLLKSLLIITQNHSLQNLSQVQSLFNPILSLNL